MSTLNISDHCWTVVAPMSASIRLLALPGVHQTAQSVHTLQLCRVHTYKVESEAGADRCRPISCRQVCSDTTSLGQASTLSKQQKLTAWNLSRSGSSGSRCVRLCTTALRTIASASVDICCRIDRMRDGRISDATYGANAPQASATRALRSACL